MSAHDPTAVTVEGLAAPRGRFPHVRLTRNQAFVSGTSSRRADNTFSGVTVDDDGTVHRDMAEQTRAVLENMRSVLESVGLGLEDLVQVTTFLADMSAFSEYNQAYGEFFTSEGPARTTVAVAALPHPDIVIEMQGIAERSSFEKGQ